MTVYHLIQMEKKGSGTLKFDPNTDRRMISPFSASASGIIEEKRKMVLNLHRERSSMTGGMRKNDPNFNESASHGNSIPPLDGYATAEGRSE